MYGTWPRCRSVESRNRKSPLPAGQSHLMSWILHLLGSNHFATTVPRATEPGFSLFFANPLFNLRSHGQIVNNFRPLRSLTLTAGVGCVSAAPLDAAYCQRGSTRFWLRPFGSCPMASAIKPPADNKEQHPCGLTARTATLYYFGPFSVKPGSSDTKPAAQQSGSRHQQRRFALTR